MSPSDAPSDRDHGIATIDGARGGSVVLLGSGASLILQLVSLVVLSRLLPPADFGLVAMVAVFVTLGNLIRDFGLPLAGLQARSLSQQQASNLFWMNAAVAGTSSGLLVCAAPALAALFDEPRLAMIVPVFALVVLIGGVTAQIQVHLARRMRFTVLVISEAVAQVIALASAIVLAVMGWGYWSLVAQSVIAASVTLGYRWIASGWIPSRPRKGHGAAGMFRTGIDYGLAQLLTFLQGNIDTIAVGAQLGAAQLGYYSRAYQLLTAPASRLLDPLTQVVVATINRVKSTGRNLEPLLLKVQFAIGAFIVWIFATSAGIAPDLIPVVLGDRWTPSVGVFQVLAIGGCLSVFNHVSYWMFIIYEKSRELLYYNLVSKPLAIVSILVGLQFGLIGVAWGYAVAMMFSWPLNTVWLARTAGISMRRFLAGGLRVLFAGVIAALGSWGMFTLAEGIPPVLAMSAGVLTGSAAMLLALACIRPSRLALKESFVFAAAMISERRMEKRHAPH